MSKQFPYIPFSQSDIPVEAIGQFDPNTDTQDYAKEAYRRKLLKDAYKEANKGRVIASRLGAMGGGTTIR